MSDAAALFERIDRTMRDMEQIKTRLQAQTLARWWKVGCDYEAQAFWMNAADILAGPHSIEVSKVLDAGRVVAIRSYGGGAGRLVFGSDAARDAFLVQLSAGVR